MELRTAARNPLKKGHPSADSRQEMESKINLAQVAPVNYKVTAALVNQFVVSTTQFLNRFVTRCDRKLHQVAAKMCRIQVRFHHHSLTNAASAHSPPRDRRRRA
jgi:hypothetical protein